MRLLERRVEAAALRAGRGEGAGGADWDEAGDGAVHEDAGEGRLREAGRSGGAAAAAGGPAGHQPAAEPQVTGEAGLPGSIHPHSWNYYSPLFSC